MKKGGSMKYKALCAVYDVPDDPLYVMPIVEAVGDVEAMHEVLKLFRAKGMKLAEDYRILSISVEGDVT